MSEEKIYLAWAKKKKVFDIGTFIKPIQIIDEWNKPYCK